VRVCVCMASCVGGYVRVCMYGFVFGWVLACVRLNVCLFVCVCMCENVCFCITHNNYKVEKTRLRSRPDDVVDKWHQRICLLTK
jgi:hypothetical protein